MKMKLMLNGGGIYIVILTLFLILSSSMLHGQCDPACADASLSNISGTAIPESLVPNDDNVDLGGSGTDEQFRNIYMQDASSSMLLYYVDHKFLHIKGGTSPGGDYPENIFLGIDAGNVATSSNHGSVGIGDKSLETLTGMAGHNTAVGWYSLKNLTSGGKNAMLGSRAGELISTGSSNVGIGQNVFYNNDDAPQITGDGNIAIGGTSSSTGLIGNLTSGDFNIVVGYDALKSLTSGDNNTIIGHASGADIVNGNMNIFIGSEAGVGAFGTIMGENNIVIGNNLSVNSSDVDLSNRLNIGDLLFGDLDADKFSIGNNAATLSSTFNVGTADEFQVNSTGDLVRINDVAYSWPDDDGATGHFLQSNGSGDLSWASGVNIQVFTGTTTLWAKPDGAQTVTVICIGGGGGGGSGGIGDDMSGGSGGGAGGVSEMTFQAAALSSYVVAYAGPRWCRRGCC
jgi:hypothetical protein